MQPIHIGNIHIYREDAILYVTVPDGNVHRAHTLPSWCVTPEQLLQLRRMLPFVLFDYGSIKLAVNAFAVEEIIPSLEEDKKLSILFWNGTKVDGVDKTFSDPFRVVDNALAAALAAQAQGD